MSTVEGLTDWIERLIKFVRSNSGDYYAATTHPYVIGRLELALRGDIRWVTYAADFQAGVMCNPISRAALLAIRTDREERELTEIRADAMRQAFPSRS